MSILDALKNEVVGAVGGGAEHSGMVEGVLGMLNQPGSGGLAGMAQAFEKQGLGQLMAGWVGNGPNPGITPAQVQQVLGSGKIGELAQQAGISPEVASSALATILPTLIDRLTPGGAIPQQQHGLLGDALGGLLKNL
jgi:uncharacterized protein YidB (DUF937 family)